MTSTLAEPEWDEETRGWARALLWHDSGLCGCGCGFPANVAQDPTNEGRFNVDDPVRCHARTALELKQERMAAGESPQPHALLLSVELMEGDGG